MMTGRELIMFILENHLEDEVIFKDGIPIGFMTVGQFAEQTGVGAETVRVWAMTGMIKSTQIGGTIYIPATATNPLKTSGTLT